MTRVLLDTHVVLDALLDREPWVAQAKTIWAAQLNNRIAAHITAASLTDIFYLSRRLVDRTKARMGRSASRTGIR
jgi:predicted nucleic acid-binding protein